MLSKSQITFLKSLQQKQHRKEQGLFLVEGLKSLLEFAGSDYTIKTIFHTPQAVPKMLNLSRTLKLEELAESDLKKISTLTTPQNVIALVQIPAWPELQTADLQQSFSLVLDGIQDPGNLGTIIRTADWFGIRHLICSPDTVDAYNPKVVQATMGSLARVRVHYVALEAFLSRVAVPVYGALLNGHNIYNTGFGSEGVVILGNEGNGIRADVQKHVHKAVTIPQSGKVESLNVATAAAIFCSEISRNRLK